MPLLNLVDFLNTLLKAPYRIDYLEFTKGYDLVDTVELNKENTFLDNLEKEYLVDNNTLEVVLLKALELDLFKEVK